MSNQQRFWLIRGSLLLTISSVIIGLILYALQHNLNLYYTPKEIYTQQVPANAEIRLGGMVKTKSLKRHHGLQLQFILTDYQHEILVHYNGVLPDLFRDNQGIVAIGKLTPQKTFMASKILAKHDAKYMPPNLNLALKPKNNHAN